MGDYFECLDERTFSRLSEKWFKVLQTIDFAESGGDVIHKRECSYIKHALIITSCMPNGWRDTDDAAMYLGSIEPLNTRLLNRFMRF